MGKQPQSTLKGEESRKASTPHKTKSHALKSMFKNRKSLKQSLLIHEILKQKLDLF